MSIEYVHEYMHDKVYVNRLCKKMREEQNNEKIKGKNKNFTLMAQNKQNTLLLLQLHN